jgi:hypothetical protein
MVSLTTISDHPEADIKWSRKTVWDRITEADVVLLPYSGAKGALAKSANRAVQAMSLGVPIVAYPIPAYSNIVRHDRNGFLCATYDEWIEAFSRLRDREVRARIAELSYRYARRYFGMRVVGDLWQSLFASLCRKPIARERPCDWMALNRLRAIARLRMRTRHQTRDAAACSDQVALHCSENSKHDQTLDATSSADACL